MAGRPSPSKKTENTSLATFKVAIWMPTDSTARSPYFNAQGVRTMTTSDIEDLIEILNTRGGSAYFGEPVSILEHSLQAAHSAEVAGAGAAAISAALLHDLGHMLHGLEEDIAQRGQDGLHEEIAATYLSRWFEEDVTTPIRLHVPAKRFLCWRDREYFARLSPASVQSLALQGGPMDDEQATVFLRNPFAQAAIALRQWDDDAKIPGLRVPGAAHYLPALRAVRRGEVTLGS
jgi:phosphonate degradation associated HDIG domain protein